MCMGMWMCVDCVGLCWVLGVCWWCCLAAESGHSICTCFCVCVCACKDVGGVELVYFLS